ncbi:MAG TPA: hypothetical protein VI976_01885, partial [Candidatus Omnitrophota bacterium]|nr:hypothetical protein [Candidatus Omnitrophota bacterium]
ADLQLKKDTAAFTSPETPEGKEYWAKLYKKAGELLGSENIEIPTLTRPWIVPGEVIIRSSSNSAYVYKATLKVMLEEDYLTYSNAGLERGFQTRIDYAFKDPRLKELNEYSTQLIKELIIPKLTQEVNTSKRYASLRQVFYSLVLAQWFKKNFANSTTANYTQLIDRQNLSGLTSKTSWSKETYFQEYQKSFKDGEYNLKETLPTLLQGRVIRSYFSGGIVPVVSPANLAEFKGGLADPAAAVLALNAAGAVGLKGSAVAPDETALRPASPKDMREPSPKATSSPVEASPFSSQQLRVFARDPKIIPGYTLVMTHINAGFPGEMSGISFSKKDGAFILSRKLFGNWSGASYSDIMRQLANIVASEEKSASSPVSAPGGIDPSLRPSAISGLIPLDDSKGGIDFRAISMSLELSGAFKDVQLSLPQIVNLQGFDLSQESASLKDALKAKFPLSGQRLCEYLSASFQKGELDHRRAEAVFFIAQTCKISEERGLEAATDLKQAMLLADALPAR